MDLAHIDDSMVQDLTVSVRPSLNNLVMGLFTPQELLLFVSFPLLNVLFESSEGLNLLCWWQGKIEVDKELIHSLEVIVHHSIRVKLYLVGKVEILSRFTNVLILESKSHLLVNRFKSRNRLLSL